MSDALPHRQPDRLPPRIALAGFVHESNSFAPSPADMAAFEQGGGYLPLCRGQAILTGARDVNLPVAGAIEVARDRGWDLVPLIWAGAVPSAPVTAACYEDLCDEIIAGLRRAGPLDGVFLDLHGAMVAEGAPDGEGALLARVRAVVGPGVPVVAALDLHGNISPAMVEHADRMVGFRTYPHVDMALTGRRAAAELDRLLSGAPNARAFRQLDYLIPIAWQSTDLEPAAPLYDLLGQADQAGVCASIFMGFPAADIVDCRPSVIAYAADRALADHWADRLAQAMQDAEPAFVGRSYDADAGVACARRLAAGATGPVVLADTQDNPGAGGNSDTMGMLRALIASDARDPIRGGAAIGLIADAHAAAAAHAAGVGATITLALGGRSGVAGDAPLVADYVVEALSDGHCHATGPYYGGAHLRLGPSACLRIGAVRIAVASEKAQMADRAMFACLGIVAEDQAILVVKSSNHFRADFAPIAQAILTCTAPGPMALSPAALPFRHLAPGLRLEPCGRPFVPPPVIPPPVIPPRKADADRPADPFNREDIPCSTD